MICIVMGHKPITATPDRGPNAGKTATVCAVCGKVLQEQTEARKEWRSGYRDYEVQR